MAWFGFRRAAPALFAFTAISGCDNAQDKAEAKDVSRAYVAQHASSPAALPPGVLPDSIAARTHTYWQAAATIYNACAYAEESGSAKVRKEFVLPATLAQIGKLKTDGVDPEAIGAIGQLANLQRDSDAAKQQILKNQAAKAGAASQPADAMDQLKAYGVTQLVLFAQAQAKITAANARLEQTRDRLYERYSYSLRPIVIGTNSCLTARALTGG